MSTLYFTRWWESNGILELKVKSIEGEGTSAYGIVFADGEKRYVAGHIGTDVFYAKRNAKKYVRARAVAIRKMLLRRLERVDQRLEECAE